MPMFNNNKNLNMFKYLFTSRKYLYTNIKLRTQNTN